MDSKNFSTPVSIADVRVTDDFWKKEMELVRTQVIPYQWEALNDRIESATPSYCMHNFKCAAKLNREKEKKGTEFQAPVYTYRGFEVLPDDPRHPDDEFYGFVFQDSDFYKWIEAVAYSLAQHPDEQLEKIADEAIDIVSAAQQENGYLDTYYILNGMDQIFTNIRDHHELYCLGHLLEGAVAYYQATGKRKLLDTACRYADFVGDYFGEEGKCKGYPGHEIAEMALLRLYELTEERRYLELSLFFINERGARPYYFDGEHPEDIRNKPEDMRYEYHQAHVPVREQDEAVGHAVRGVYLYSAMTDAARITGDDSLYQACEKLWKSVTEKKMYITGGIGGTHIGESFSYNYDLPNDTAYAETCASIGLIFWARRMLEIHPDSRYADVMERALYNGVLSGMALDGKSFFYVNPLEVYPEACHKDERKIHVKPVRQKWFGCACCPPNLARLISSISSYAYTEQEDTLFVHLYMGSCIRKLVDGKEVNVHVESNLPWDGKVKIRVTAEDVPFTLAVRIPEWGRNYTIKGAENCTQKVKDGYLYLTGNWKETEEILLDFPMKVQILKADFRVRENAGKVAVTRGPLVYCMEEVDNGENLHLLTLDCNSDCETEDFKIQETMVTSVRMKGYRQVPDEIDSLYYPVNKVIKNPVQLRFVPYYIWANRGENEMTVWVRQEI